MGFVVLTSVTVLVVCLFVFLFVTTGRLWCMLCDAIEVMWRFFPLSRLTLCVRCYSMVGWCLAIRVDRTLFGTTCSLIPLIVLSCLIRVCRSLRLTLKSDVGSAIGNTVSSFPLMVVEVFETRTWRITKVLCARIPLTTVAILFRSEV